jgi:hypothetical protein
MRRAAPLLFALALAAGLVTVPAAPAADEPLVDRVKKSIDDGVGWLKRQQNGNGGWGGAGHPGGHTSLALLALLESGVPPDDPVIQRGLAYLRSLPLDQTYDVGLQTMVFAKVGDPADLPRIQKHVDWLVAARGDDGWTYGKLGLGNKNGDNSNT